MSEKEKVKPVPRYRRFIFPIVFVTLSICGVVIVFVLISPMISGRIFKTALDPEFMPTAEYLLENPMPNPHQLNLYVEHNTSVFDETDVEVFCIHLIVPHGHRSDIVQFQFNRSPVWGTIFYGTLEGLEGSDGYLNKFCIYGQIESGLHLVTLRLNEEMFGETYTHEWAIEIP